MLLLVFSTLREMGQQREKKWGSAVRDRTRFYDKNGKKAESKMEVRFSDASFETE